MVGTFTTLDPDIGGSFTYMLVAGIGSAGNSIFQIVGSELRARIPLDYEAKSGYTIRVRSADQGGLWIEKALALNVLDINEAPTDLLLSSLSIAEGLPRGTVVGQLTAKDPDGGSVFSYELVPGPGSAHNALFEIVGSELRAAGSFDFESASSYSIRIRSTDQAGLYAEKVFAIGVMNVNETPTGLSISSTGVLEYQPAGSLVEIGRAHV